jgi:outer membrane immunogenic protein
MKHLKLFISIVYIFFLAIQNSAAKSLHPQKSTKINIEQDVDTLGGNEDLIKMAHQLKSSTRTRIVQDRIVDRRNRVELALSYGAILGGDSYLQTQNLGFTVNYHFTPRWSLGMQYSDFTNNLTPEGKRVFSQYRQNQAAGGIPAYAVDVDYPINATMAVVNWYPFMVKQAFLTWGLPNLTSICSVALDKFNSQAGIPQFIQ